MNKLLIGIGGAIWAGLCFRTALSIHFPTEPVQERLQYEAQKAGYDVQTDNIGPSGIIGIGMDNAKISKVNKRNKTSTPLLTLDSLSITINPVMLLVSKLSSNIQAELLSGSVDVSYQRSMSTEGVFAVQSELEDINLAQLPIAGDSWSVDALGTLNWTNDSSINTNKIRESRGSGKLTIDGFAIDGGKVAGIDLMELSFDEAELSYTIEKGKINIDKGTFSGEQISIDIEGNIMLKKRLGNSRLALELIMSFGDDLKMMARFIPGLEDMGDDQYKLTIGGSISKPSIGSESKPTSSRQRGSRGGARNKSETESSGDASSSALDRKMDRKTSSRSGQSLEERRAARAKRLEERRTARQKRLEEQRLNPSEMATGGRSSAPRGIPSMRERADFDEELELEGLDEEEEFEDLEELDEEYEEDEIYEEDIDEGIEEPSDDYED